MIDPFRQTLRNLVDCMLTNRELETELRRDLKTATEHSTAAERDALCSALANFVADVLYMHPRRGDLPIDHRRCFRYVAHRLSIVDWEQRYEALEDEWQRLLEDEIEPIDIDDFDRSTPLG